MRKYLIAALLVGSFAAAPAFAQDTASVQADTSVRAPFTGFRVEGIVGYDRTQVPDAHSNGVTYGAGIGYDFQAGNLLVGAEAEATESSVGDCASGVNTAGDQLCFDTGRDLYVGGRIGGVVGGSTLLYAKAGYTNARLGVTYDANTVGTTGDFDLRSNYDGVRVGAGVEHAIGTNAFIKAEYRYSNYEQGLEKHQGVVGFGFRF
jgi:outer membrane immunogenic protein